MKMLLLYHYKTQIVYLDFKGSCFIILKWKKKPSFSQPDERNEEYSTEINLSRVPSSAPHGHQMISGMTHRGALSTVQVSLVHLHCRILLGTFLLAVALMEQLFWCRLAKSFCIMIAFSLSILYIIYMTYISYIYIVFTRAVNINGIVNQSELHQTFKGIFKSLGNVLYFALITPQ